MSLKKQALNGIIWKLAEQFGARIISFGVSIILARLLLPSDFGAIAMFMVVISIAKAIIEGGLASSLIRTKNVNDEDLATVFWFNLLASILLYVLVYFCAPLIAQFYDMDILTELIRVYSIILIINSLVVIQKTIFEKEMDFKTNFRIQLPSLLIGGVSGVVFAYTGFGVWSLVYYQIIQTTIYTAQYWFYSNWRPKFIFSKDKFYYHFNYGYKLMLSQLLNQIYKNIYSIVIGKMFSPAQLGYYDRANSLKQMPVNNLSTALDKVTFPLFARIATNHVKLKEAYKQVMKTVVFIIAPVLCLLIVIAEPLIRSILTEKWLPVVPYFQVLAISGILYPIHSYNLNILKVKGRSDLFLKLEVVKKIIITITLLITMRFGVIGIVWGQVFTSVVAFFINTYFTGKFINYTTWYQTRDLLPTIIASGSIAVLVFYIDEIFFIQVRDLYRIIFNSLIFVMLYFSVVFLFKFKEIDYIKKLITIK